jgi:hypothetical protein
MDAFGNRKIPAFECLHRMEAAAFCGKNPGFARLGTATNGSSFQVGAKPEFFKKATADSRNLVQIKKNQPQPKLRKGCG